MQESKTINGTLGPRETDEGEQEKAMKKTREEENHTPNDQSTEIHSEVFPASVANRGPPSARREAHGDP